MQPEGQARRATIGYLVYKINALLKSSNIAILYKIPYRHARRVHARTKVSCIQYSYDMLLLFNVASVLNHSTVEFRDFSKRAPGS